MARPRQPIDLIIAKGKTNLTKAEIAQRRAEELHVPDKYTDIEAPDYLPETLKEEFYEISHILLDIGVMTELDEDTLARYLLAQQQYLQFTSMLNKAMRSGSLAEVERLSRLQDKAFNQCRAGANDLGLTLKSRANLALPKTEEPKANKFLEKFGE